MRLHGFCIVIAFLLAADASAEGPETREYSRRGEVSPGAQAPTNAAMLAAIEHGSPEQLKATLEYGERVYCAPCVPLLERRLLASGEPRVRELSAWWLRRQPFAAPVILAKLKKVLAESGDGVQRARAAEALGEFMDVHALEVLAASAERDADPNVRSAAVRALARLNTTGSAPALARALADPAREVRASALDVLIVVSGFRDFSALLPLLGDPDPQLRAHAARLCGEVRLAAAEAPLTAMLRGDSAASARKNAAWALGRIGGASGRAALQMQKGQERDALVLGAIEIAERMPSRAP